MKVFLTQIGVPKSLLNQINIDSKYFKWSKGFRNLYSQQFRHFTFIEGYTFKTENNFCGYVLIGEMKLAIVILLYLKKKAKHVYKYCMMIF
jgi:hypothetical protein